MLPKKPPLFKCPVQFVATQGRCGNTQSLTFIVKGQVLSSSEKGPFQLDDYFVSFRILLHSWAPFFYAASVYKTCMQSHYIHAAHSVHAHTHTRAHTQRCTSSAVCSMIWWKTRAGRSRVDHWLNLSPRGVYGSGRVRRGEERGGRLEWETCQDGKRGKKGAGSKGWEREL